MRSQRRQEPSNVIRPDGKPTFRSFYAVYCAQQGFTPTPVHWEIVDWLENHEQWGNKTAVLQVWRSVGKSTIVALYAVWRLVVDPTLRIMILSGVTARANRLALSIGDPNMGLIANHPMSKHLYNKKNIWRADEFWVTGSRDPANPSICAKGLDTAFTGFRADLVILDDPEVPENSDSPGLRENLRRKVSETAYIIDPRNCAERLFIGTPQTYESIYPEVIEKLNPSYLTLPVMTGVKGEFPYLTGEYYEPNHYGEEFVLKKQLEASTKGEFFNQYLLERVSVEDSRFNPALLIPYDFETEWTSTGGESTCTIGPYKMHSVSCFWDPALSSSSRDDSVIALVYGADDGHYFIHRVNQLKGDAEEQCDQVIAFCLKNNVNRIIVESNGVGAFLPNLLRKRAAPQGIAVIGKFTTQNKTQKLREAYEVRLSAGRLHCHRSVLATKFTQQLRDFNPKRANTQHDDFIDAPAAAILNEPIRISAVHSPEARMFGLGRQSKEIVMEMDEISF